MLDYFTYLLFKHTDCHCDFFIIHTYGNVKHIFKLRYRWMYRYVNTRLCRKRRFSIITVGNHVTFQRKKWLP